MFRNGACMSEDLGATAPDRQMEHQLFHARRLSLYSVEDLTQKPLCFVPASRSIEKIENSIKAGTHFGGVGT